MKAEEQLEELAREVSVCERCRLHASRKHAVPGEGPANADIMFIGEGPGFHENEQGRPFVGAAGKFLEELLASIGYQRDRVFICNVVKCRPPGNRDPLPDEIEACRPYLDRQIAAIHPKIIVTLGRYSMARFFGDAKISAIHGKAQLTDGRLLVAMFHPAAALHQPSLKRTVEEDFHTLPDLIKRASQMAQAEPVSPAEQPKQLSLL